MSLNAAGRAMEVTIKALRNKIDAFQSALLNGSIVFHPALGPSLIYNIEVCQKELWILAGYYQNLDKIQSLTIEQEDQQIIVALLTSRANGLHEFYQVAIKKKQH